MNLTGRPVYQKGQKGPRRGARPPNAAERRHWDRVLQVPCIAGPAGCKGRLMIHHCGTGAGGRKDHMKVLPLCYGHHQGPDGIDGREHGMSKKKWQAIHGTEDELLEKLNIMLKLIK